ncbi:MAG: hypothetical protein CSB47_10935 [Proteobacteria bacterium]|nr:MAG: hypothetical protein CSB47_10935 [Pseudomonadota bacterium]
MAAMALASIRSHHLKHASGLNLPLSGRGRSFASFGEIVQGRLSTGEDFLVTLPIELWSKCRLSVQPRNSQHQIITPWPKARQLAELLLDKLASQESLSVTLEFDRNIPVGKGLSSSTADLLAIIRSFQMAFQFTMSQAETSKLLVQIEAHDPLHYDNCVVYNHRQGQLLNTLHYTPNYHIIGIDQGGELSSEAYNANLQYGYSDLQQYDALYQALLTAFERQDDLAIAHCATQSAMLHAKRTHNIFLNEVLAYSEQHPAVMGVVATHSGTCAGLLIVANCPQPLSNTIANEASQFGHIFETRTLRRAKSD